MSNNDDAEAALFVEIFRRDDDEASLPPKLVEAYVAVVEPKRCGSLLKILGRDLPLVGTTTNDAKSDKTTGTSRPLPSSKPPASVPRCLDLSHLKRVKKPFLSLEKNNNGTQSPTKKKAKHSDDENCKNQQRAPLLEILLQSVDSLDGAYGKERMKTLAPSKDDNLHSSSIVDFLKQRYQIEIIEKRTVPGRPPESHQEWQDAQQKYWPTVFFPQKSKEHKDQLLQLSNQELQQMTKGMQEAIQDCQKVNQSQSGGDSSQQLLEGAIIMDPKNALVVSTSADERTMQMTTSSSGTNSTTKADTAQSETKTTSILNNPLATPILLAIQGVSRIERNKAVAAGMGSTDFQKGQYLCTNYDLYTTLEPTVFEAMALVHSRIRRIVFGKTRRGGRGGIHQFHIHALPSTNHHFRAFQCQPECESDLWKQCQQLPATGDLAS
ncbi:inactive tRNA-specific adenosine deaminase-like protein 3 [Seminavis robusta]|uniref:Inactive tRNA-specific adenosine deaminase-like protein 3 n=1 Tax=Seminavis robusta TaxID=568900 RepID=A0A9N8HCD6_9STRA|nr:inactive tRNA-specific adenosine deaminase-like protein 3 [Seminavis robusta]|eukprot:Sro215_g088990.1 inactive tRNA-specific adenosine deaminase-like protein 3 (437) ;mRNA; f:32823-34133